MKISYARMAVQSCCTDARWVWQNRNHSMVLARCEIDPKYAATIAQYLPLGCYIETGKHP